MQGGATFQFATDGIESAREQLLVYAQIPLLTFELDN
jgi:hypothetical protein